MGEMEEKWSKMEKSEKKERNDGFLGKCQVEWHLRLGYDFLEILFKNSKEKGAKQRLKCRTG